MDVLKIFVSSLNITRSFGFISIINVKYKMHMFHFRFAKIQCVYDSILKEKK